MGIAKAAIWFLIPLLFLCQILPREGSIEALWPAQSHSFHRQNLSISGDGSFSHSSHHHGNVGHSASHKFRRRQGNVMAEGSVTLHSHRFPGLPGCCGVAQCLLLVEEQGAMGVGGTTTWPHSMEWKLSNRRPCCGSNCSVQLFDPRGQTPSLFPVVSSAISLELDSVFTEPFSALPLIDQRGVKPKIREAPRKVCLFSPQSFSSFSDLVFLWKHGGKVALWSHPVCSLMLVPLPKLRDVICVRLIFLMSRS